MHDWSSKVTHFARGAWRELPLETLAVALAALSSLAAIHSHVLPNALDIWLARCIVCSVLVTPLLFANTLLTRRGVLARKTQLAAGTGIAIVVWSTLLVIGPDTVDDLEQARFVWPGCLALVAFVLVPFVVTALSTSQSERTTAFTHFVRVFFEQTTIWGLLWLGSMGALGVIIFALGDLFDLGGAVDRPGLDAAVVVTGAIVLTYLYRLLPPAEQDRPQPKLPELWRRLVLTIGAPFVSAMLIILVVYEIAVLVQGELPRNLLSPLIIAAGFVGFISTVLIMSMLGESVGSDALTPAEPHRWAKRPSIRLVRVFPVVLLALLPMAVWALALRIEQYGFTPFRVVRLMSLLCLAVLGTLGTLRWLRGRMALTWEVPACIVPVALVTAFGPLSAVSIAIESQTARLQQMLEQAGTTNATVAATAPAVAQVLDREVYWQLDAQIRDVYLLGGTAALGRVLDGSVEHCIHNSCLRYLGISYPGDLGVGFSEQHTTGWTEGPFRGRDLWLDTFRISAGNDHQTVTGRLVLRGQSVQLIRRGTIVAEASLLDLMETWQQTKTMPTGMIELRDRSGGLVGQLAVKHLEFASTPEGVFEIMSIQGFWLEAIP